jgi:FkbM family methyltransferase
MRQKIKLFILNFITLSQYFKIIDWTKKQFIPGKNQININILFTLLSKKLKRVSFVQIGANDGIKNDPIFPYVRKYQWRGILVEPLPNLFEKLVVNYEADKALVFENVGIGDKNEEMNFYYLPPEYNYPDWLQQIGTFDKNAIEFNLSNFPEVIGKVEARKIKVITLKELFKKNEISKIDLLIVDAEGFEYKILRQLSELPEKPSYILFEWGCMKEDVRNALFDLLRELEYKLYSGGGDVLAALKEF